MKHTLILTTLSISCLLGGCIFIEDDAPTTRPMPTKDMSKDLGSDMSGDMAHDMVSDTAPDLPDVTEDMVDPPDIMPDLPVMCKENPPEGLLCCAPTGPPTNTKNNPMHCGDCDTACNPGDQCQQGVCVCPSGATPKLIDVMVSESTHFAFRGIFNNSRNLCKTSNGTPGCGDADAFVLDPDPYKASHVAVIYDRNKAGIQAITLDGYGNKLTTSDLVFPRGVQLVEHADMVPFQDGMLLQVLFKNRVVNPTYNLTVFYIKQNDTGAYVVTPFQSANGAPRDFVQIEQFSKTITSFVSGLNKNMLGGAWIVKEAQQNKIEGTILIDDKIFKLAPQKIDIAATLIPRLGIAQGQIGPMRRLMVSWWNSNEHKAAQWDITPQANTDQIQATLVGNTRTLGLSDRGGLLMPPPLLEPLGYDDTVGWIFHGVTYTDNPLNIAEYTSEMDLILWNTRVQMVTKIPLEQDKTIFAPKLISAFKDDMTLHTWLKNKRSMQRSQYTGRLFLTLSQNATKQWGNKPLSRDDTYVRKASTTAFLDKSSVMALNRDGVQQHSLHFFQASEIGPICTLPERSAMP